MNPLLVRHVTAGLLAAGDSFRAGALPRPRLAWELRVRVEALAALGPPPSTLTRLRWLYRAVETADPADTADPEIVSRTVAEMVAVLDTGRGVRSTGDASAPPVPVSLPAWRFGHTTLVRKGEL